MGFIHLHKIYQARVTENMASQKSIFQMKSNKTKCSRRESKRYKASGKVPLNFLSPVIFCKICTRNTWSSFSILLKTYHHFFLSFVGINIIRGPIIKPFSPSRDWNRCFVDPAESMMGNKERPVQGIGWPANEMRKKWSWVFSDLFHIFIL